MNQPFSIKFQIFYHSSITENDLRTRQELCQELHTILKNIISDSPDKYKYLNRCEPAISSLDEKKQLRMCEQSYLNPIKEEAKYIEFNQSQSYGEYFSLQEIKMFSQKIKEELDKYLLDNSFFYRINDPIIYYEIDDPIIFICASDIQT